MLTIKHCQMFLLEHRKFPQSIFSARPDPRLLDFQRLPSVFVDHKPENPSPRDPAVVDRKSGSGSKRSRNRAQGPEVSSSRQVTQSIAALIAGRLLVPGGGNLWFKFRSCRSHVPESQYKSPITDRELREQDSIIFIIGWRAGLRYLSDTLRGGLRNL
jgi:hypothetical protein